MTYDAEDEGAAYVHLVDDVRPGEAVRQEVVSGGNVVLDFDAQGKLLGIEILDANLMLRPETIARAERIT
jgi:uncharacterized protein YuzE